MWPNGRSAGYEPRTGAGTTRVQLTSTKTKTVVGLEIEADSIAATEVRANGRVEVAGYGIEPLATGVFREGEVGDTEALTRLAQGAVLAREAQPHGPARDRQPARRRAVDPDAGDRQRRRARDRDPLPGRRPHPDAARAGGARLGGRRTSHRPERRAPDRGRRRRGAARHADAAARRDERRRPACRSASTFPRSG